MKLKNYLILLETVNLQTFLIEIQFLNFVK